MKNNLFLLVFLISCPILAAACGGSGGSGSSSSGGAPSITTISELPTATSPMASSAQASVVKGAEKAAATGLVFSTTSSSSFELSDSRGSCEMFNQVKRGIASASVGDKILCYIKNLNDSNKFQNGNINIYDGSWHTFDLNATADPRNAGKVPGKIKMRIARSGTTITNFEMFMCGTLQGTTSQLGYIKQQISGSSLTMTSRMIHENTASVNSIGRDKIDVTGTLNSSDAFTAKTIEIKHTGDAVDGSGHSWEEGTMSQSIHKVIYSGYQAWSDSLGSGWQNVYGVAQMIGDDNADISVWALGDGAVKFGSTGTGTEETGTGAWLGDGAGPVIPSDSSDYFASASAGTPKAASSQEISISFDADQTWDCSDMVELTIQGDEATLNRQCAEYTGMISGDSIECWRIFH